MPKRKKLTEKEWKRQLEEKAAFEASERAAKREFIYNKLRNAQIGDLIAETNLPDFPETIIEIDREDCDDDPELFNFTTNYGNVYQGSEFLFDAYPRVFPYDEDESGVFFVETTEQEINEDQISFDDIAVAYSTNETAENMPEPAPVLTSAASSALIGFKVSAKSKLKIFRTTTDARAALNLSKTARRRGAVGKFLPNDSKNCLGRGVWRCEAVRASPS
ncbi:MAG: hypothetical protein ACI4YB_02130 [Oscillospiraceae bacterium]